MVRETLGKLLERMAAQWPHLVCFPAVVGAHDLPLGGALGTGTPTIEGEEEEDDSTQQQEESADPGWW